MEGESRGKSPPMRCYVMSLALTWACAWGALPVSGSRTDGVSRVVSMFRRSTPQCCGRGGGKGRGVERPWSHRRGTSGFPRGPVSVVLPKKVDRSLAAFPGFLYPGPDGETSLCLAGLRVGLRRPESQR